MVPSRTELREMLTALLVVALFCLNFGHQAPAVAYSADLTPYLVADGTPIPNCEQHPGDHGQHDTTCHLCRLGAGLDLAGPNAPCVTIARTVAAVAYAGTPFALPSQPATATRNARAPPLA